MPILNIQLSTENFMPSWVSFADFVSLLNSPPADVATLTGSDRCVISRVNDRDIRPTVLRTTLDPAEFDAMISSVGASDLWSDVDRKTAALRLLSVHVFEEIGSDHPSDEYELVLGADGVVSDPPRWNISAPDEY